MMKKLWVSVLLILIIGGGYFFIKLTPPLEVGTLVSSRDNKSVVVVVGNKGFREVKILDVTVNNNEKPLKTRLQISNEIQGFIVTNDDTNKEAEKYDFVNIDEIAIKTGTSPSARLKKLDERTASKDNEIYGVSIFHNEEVNKVHIRYSYLGISFNETVILN